MTFVEIKSNSALVSDHLVMLMPLVPVIDTVIVLGRDQVRSICHLNEDQNLEIVRGESSSVMGVMISNANNIGFMGDSPKYLMKRGNVFDVVTVEMAPLIHFEGLHNPHDEPVSTVDNGLSEIRQDWMRSLQKEMKRTKRWLGHNWKRMFVDTMKDFVREQSIRAQKRRNRLRSSEDEAPERLVGEKSNRNQEQDHEKEEVQKKAVRIEPEASRMEMLPVNSVNDVPESLPLDEIPHFVQHLDSHKEKDANEIVAVREEKEDANELQQVKLARRSNRAVMKEINKHYLFHCSVKECGGSFTTPQAVRRHFYKVKIHSDLSQEQRDQMIQYALAHRTKQDLVRCSCSSEEEKGYMIVCDKCHYWVHGDCFGRAPGSVSEEEEFYCHRHAPRHQ